MTVDTNHLFTLDARRRYPVLTRGEGVYVWDDAGNRYLDAIAGIAVVNLGYGRQEVVDALSAQAARLPFAVGNIFASEPAHQLAAKVASITPGDLDWVHFTSGGSEAVEVALKLARQVHVERGEGERSTFISRWTSYHGATLATLSVGGAKGRRKKYEPLLLDVPHISPPYCYRDGHADHEGCGERYAAELESAILAAGPRNVAAFIAEPIIASVGGTIAPPDDYFPLVREICDRYGVLLIVDEVVTGFGRTGADFAIDHWGVVPDILAMGKGISGGYAPLGAVAVRESIRTSFREAGATFEHIFTFGGNPVSMAAGVAVLDIWEREGVTARVRDMEPAFRAALEPLRAHPFVGDIRIRGLMAGIEFVRDQATKEPFESSDGVAVRFREAGLRNGIVVYPGTGMADGARGDIISLYPPLTITADEIGELGERLRATFDAVAPTLPR
ncbi:MAG: aspartate aminotransferase family protein [Chloroflexota bacterium]